MGLSSDTGAGALTAAVEGGYDVILLDVILLDVMLLESCCRTSTDSRCAASCVPSGCASPS
jgi:hypothetical protein